jgi:hypothetical protein
MYNTAVLDGIMQKHSTNSSQVTVLGVNDETLGVIGNPGMFLMRLKTPYNYNKSKYYRESYF